MKGEKTLRILETLEITARNVGKLIDAMTSGYAESYRKLRMMQPSNRAPLTEKLKKRWEERHKARMFIGYLKKDGLIKVNDTKVSLTTKGASRLRGLRERSAKEILRPSYQISPGNQVILVVFDVPEKQKRKRVWLRLALKQLGFRMIQRSVWFGKVRLPREFLKNLERQGLLDCVEIFAITKEGSLKRV